MTSVVIPDGVKKIGNGQMEVGFINSRNDSFYYVGPAIGNNMSNLVICWRKVEIVINIILLCLLSKHPSVKGNH